MSEPVIIPPAGATDAQIEEFIASVRKEARQRVRQLIAAGAPADEIMEYLAGADAAAENPDDV